ATFDSALDGVVRVSVVATGIDHLSMERIEPAPAPVRAEAPVRTRSVASRPFPTPIAPEAAPEPAPVHQAPMAIAPAPAAPQVPDDVEVRPAAPRSVPVYHEPAALRHEEEAIEEEFIPPAPEQPTFRPRMPQIEELPPIAQNQLRMQRGEAAAPVHPAETRRRSLLEKLAAFGISRHEDPAPGAPAPRAIAPPAAAQRAPAPPSYAEYGRPQPRPVPARPAQGALDPHGRAAPRGHVEDDQLEIPAFLRRQSNQ
ncbi:MAG: cell division protein FtsZ, partial [Hyphomicrobiales bacterium]|nr:cell division protein FtsZ [Hyphomicrobiales bacterium]